MRHFTYSADVVDSAMPARDFSVVIPVYCNEGCVCPMFEALRTNVLERTDGLTGEIIFVDDGSSDNSYQELVAIQQAHPTLVNVIKLTRNFGQVNALTAGFYFSRSRCIITLSADGQDPPELINDMLQAHFREHFEVVVCARGGRDESAYRVFTSRIFYNLMRKLAFPNMPEGGFDFVLMSRRALEVYLRNTDAQPFVQGHVLWMGFKMKIIEYFRRARIAGASRWTFGKKITYLLDGVLSFSFVPIRAMSWLGFLTALLGFAYAVLVFFLRLFYSNPVQGWAPLMIVVLVLGGMQMLMLGVIGEYLWRTLAQTRNRDLFVVEKILPSQPAAITGAPARLGASEIRPIG
jgi:glycosyltransferase involved in cell wall biosynthesis